MDNGRPFKEMKDRNGRTLTEFLKEKERERPRGLVILRNACRPRLSMTATVKKIEEDAQTLDENANNNNNNNAAAQSALDECQNKEHNLRSGNQKDANKSKSNLTPNKKRYNLLDSPGIQVGNPKNQRSLRRLVLLDGFNETVDSETFSPMIVSTPKVMTVSEAQSTGGSLTKKFSNRKNLKGIAEEKPKDSERKDITKSKSASKDPEIQIEKENEKCQKESSASASRKDVEPSSPAKQANKKEESHREEIVLKPLSPVNDVEAVPPTEESLNKVSLIHEEDGNINETEKEETRRSSVALDLVLNNGAKHESPSKRAKNKKKKNSLTTHLWDLRLKRNLKKETLKTKQSMPLNKEPGLAINGEAFAEELKILLAGLTNREILDLRKRHSGSFEDSVHLMPKRKSIIPNDLTEGQKIQLCTEIEIELKKRDIPIEPPSLPIELLSDNNNVHVCKNLNIIAGKIGCYDEGIAESSCPLQDFFDGGEDDDLPPIEDGERVASLCVRKENLTQIRVSEPQTVEPLPHASSTFKNTGAIPRVTKVKLVNTFDTDSDGFKKPISQPLTTKKKDALSKNHQEPSNAVINRRFKEDKENWNKRKGRSMQKSQLLNTMPLASSTLYSISSANKQNKKQHDNLPLKVLEHEGALSVQTVSKETKQKSSNANDQIFDTLKGTAKSDHISNVDPTTETPNTVMNPAPSSLNFIKDLLSRSEFLEKLRNVELETPMESLNESEMYSSKAGCAKFSELEFRLFDGVEWAYYYTEEQGAAAYMRLRPRQVTPKLPVQKPESIFIVMSGVIKATVGRTVLIKAVGDAIIAKAAVGQKYSIENLEDSVALVLVMKG